MNTLRRSVLPLIMAAVIGMPGAHAAEKLRVSTPGWAAGLGPYLMAVDKGYYAEEGIEIDFVEASGGVAIPALLSGTIDITLSGATAMSAILRGGELKIIYIVADRTPYQLWATQPQLKTLADLKGKVIGIASRGDTFEIAMRTALRRDGIPPNDFGFTALGFGGAQRAVIISGSLPAVIITSYDVDLLRAAGSLEKAHMIEDFTQTVRMPYSGVATSDRLLKTKPAIIKGFLRATSKGQRFMAAFKDQSIAILRRYSKAADTTTVATDYVTTVPTLTKDGIIPDDLARADLEVRAAIINLPANEIMSVGRVYDFAPLRAVVAELDASGWKPQP